MEWNGADIVITMLENGSVRTWHAPSVAIGDTLLQDRNWSQGDVPLTLELEYILEQQFNREAHR